ncbi:MAG: hypothetical protein KJ726_05750, partial [Verrucomicrobia bacterium]|nr:hypothetical protein [Verrucomicrobiota bacterium]
DTNNIADEDGVSFPAPLVVGSGAQADVTCSAGGFVWAWIDYDGNGSWAEATDLVFPGTAVTAGLNSLAFTVPGTAAGGYTFARFRFITNQIPLSYTGRVDNGEVEDYQVLLLALGEEPTAELGDAPDSSNSWGVPMTAYPFGGPPGTLANFPTVFVAGSPPFGPLHQAPMAVAWLGPIVTMENEADVGPDQDGINNLVPPIDLPDMDSVGFGPIDDGVLFPISLPHCRATTFIFLVNGFGPPMPMFVNVWFDWNRDGDWNDTMQCPDGTPVPEWAVQNLGFLPAPGLNPVPTTPFFCWHPTLTAGDPLWMRITLAELPWPPAPGGGVAGGDGPAVGYTFGETEDYYVTAYTLDENWDFGDAPDPSFPTLLVSTGAQHAVISNFILGVTVDTEADGQPDATATGDDLNNLADEDGVTVFTSFTISTQGCVDVYLTSGPGGGLLDAWVDFDGDGSWSAGEQVFTNEPLVAGWNSNLCFNVPGSAQLGPTFARFRLSSAGNLPPDGAAQDGEVEDYMVTIYQQGPADIVITNFVVVTNGLTFRWNAMNAVVYQPQCTTNQLIATDLVWRALGGTVTGPANEQTDTNAVESQKVYRVIAPYAPPP